MKDEDKIVYAYIRKSTDRADKQEDSLENQLEIIRKLAELHGYKEDEIRYFIESKSGYQDREERTVFRKMLTELDKGNTPKIILTWQAKRLSRNMTDAEKLEDRIKGDNGQKISIEKIITLQDGTFDKNTPTLLFALQFAQGKQESETTKKSVRESFIKKLNNGIYPYCRPKGIGTRKINGQRYLSATSYMDVVKKMFELRSGGMTYRNIGEELYRLGVFNKKNWQSIERTLRTRIYIGEHIDSKTKEVFTLKFAEGKPPISRALWDSVHNKKVKKGGAYGEKQKGDVLSKKLRLYPDGPKLSLSPSKGIKYYKDRKGEVNISQKEVLSKFSEKFISLISQFGEKAIKELENDLNVLYASGKLSIYSDVDNTTHELRKGILDETSGKRLNGVSIKEDASIDAFLKELKICMELKMKGIIRVQQQLKSKVQSDIKRIDEGLRNYRKLLSEERITGDEFTSDTELMKREKGELEQQLYNINIEDNNGELYSDIGVILKVMFELIRDGLYKRENIDRIGKEDGILKLIEMTTFELYVNREKELQIKLIKGLDELISLKLSNGAPDKNRTCV